MLQFIATLNKNSVILTDLVLDSGLYVSESGVQGTFTVRLSKPENCTINITAENGFVTFDDSDLDFTAENYDTPQTVTVSTDGTGFNGVFREYINLKKGTEHYGRFRLKVVNNDIETALYDDNPDSQFNWTTEVELNSLRSAAIEWLMGSGNDLTTDYPQNWTNFTGDSYVSLSNFTNLASCERGSISNDGFTVYFYRFNPTISNGKIMLHASGHGDNWAGISTNKMDDCSEYLVAQGYEVVFWYMVARGPNATNGITPVGSSYHDGFAAIESEDPYINPLKYFLNPAIAAVNYAENEGYSEIYFTGISGGGWTTLWTCFLDTRITKGFSVAGYYPIFINDVIDFDSNDYEQGFNALGDDPRSTDLIVNQYLACSHLDMICGAAQGRSYYEWHNLNDSCCFEGWYNTIYKYNVQDKLGTIGTYDSYNYDQAGEHTYTAAVLSEINDLI